MVRQGRGRVGIVHRRLLARALELGRARVDDGPQLHLGVEVGTLVAVARPIAERVEVALVLRRGKLGGELLDETYHGRLVALKLTRIQKGVLKSKAYLFGFEFKN